MKKLTVYGYRTLRPTWRFFTKISIAVLLVLLMTSRLSAQVCGSTTPYALSFDGTGDYVTIPNGLSATFTLEAWIKTSKNSRTGTDAWLGDGLIWSDVAGDGNDFILAILNNKLIFHDGNAGAQTVGAKIINDGVWHHVAVVRTRGLYNTGTVKLYVDGVQDGATGVAGYSTLNANSNIAIGGNVLDGRYYTGYIDEVRMWNTARTQAQISGSMSSNLAGNEAGLYSYLRFNEGQNATAVNGVSGQTNGTLTNMNTAAATGPARTSGWVTAGFSYSGSPYCKSLSSVTISQDGPPVSGTFSSSPTGLSINTSTGTINPGASSAGTYTVTKTTTSANGTCSIISTAPVTITAVPSATISYGSNPLCSGLGSATPTINGTNGGTFSSTTGLNINSSTGVINLATSTPGNYSVVYTIDGLGGCSLFSTNASVTIASSPAAPTVTSPVTYCRNAAATALTATGSNLFWGNGTASGSVGGSLESSPPVYVDNSYANFKTNFSTTTTNVKIISVDYYIPAWQGVNGLVLSIYNSLGTVVATSTTTTNLSAGATSVKVTSVFNASLSAAGNYSIGISSGLGNVAFDNPAFPLTEATGTVNITGVSQSATRCFTNIQFSVSNGLTAPIPSTATPGTTNYVVSQTVNGCVSPQSTIAVIVNSAPNISQLPSSGLNSYYKFEGNADDATNNNQGTLQNNPSATTNRFGIANSAYSMNGSSNYISTTNSYNNPSNFTISIWFKTSSVTGGKLIGFGDSRTGQSNTYDRHIYMNNAGQVYFGVYPGYVVTVNSPLSYNDNKWHLATASLSSTSGMALYIDGAQVGSNSSTTTAQNYSGYWKIGFGNIGGWTSQPSNFYFNGSLDDAIIYGRALTSSEVATIYNAPDGAGNNGPVCAGSSIALTAKSVTGASYLWSGPNGFSSTQQNPSMNYSSAKAGTYKLMVTLAGACSATAYTNVISSSVEGQWVGGVSNDWSNADNWCSGSLPDATTDVVITSGAVRMPVISSSAFCKNLTVNSGASITTTAAGTLNIAGLLTNNGTMTNNGTTVFNGTSGQQTFAGVTTFNHITVNNANGLALPANIVVNNVTLSAGTLVTSNFNIDVKGNWLNNASATALQAGTNTVSFTGTTPQTIGGTFETLFNTLAANNVGSTLTLTKNVKIAGNLVVAGVFDLDIYTANGTSSGGTLYLSTLGYLKIGGTNSLPANYSTNTFLVASKVEYSGTNQAISAQNYGNLVLSSSAGAVVKTAASGFSTQAKLIMNKGAGTSVTFTPASNISIGDNVELGTGTVFNGAGYTHTIGGNWINNGTFNGNTSTVVLNGATKSVSGTGTQNFNNLTIAASGITFSNQGLTLSGNLSTIGSGSFVQASGGTLNMTGNGASISGTGISIDNLTISGSGKITANNSLTFSGNLNATGATNTFAGVSGTTMILSGTNKIITGLGSFSFKNLNVIGSSVSSANFSIDGSLVVAGAFSATSGTATFTGTSVLNGVANLYNTNINGTKLQMSANSVLGIANSFNITSGAFDVTSFIPNTVDYNGSGAQTVYNTAYDDLILSNGNSKSALGANIVTWNLTIKSGTTLVSGTNTITVFGDWNNFGNFSNGGGEVAFSGAATANITGATTFNTLTLNNDANSTTILLQSDVTAKMVNMIKGTMLTGNQTLTITSDRTGNGTILGNIKRKHVFNPNTTYAFESPNNTIIFSSVSNVDSILVNVVKGSIGDFPSGASINRQYTISIPTGSYTLAKLRLHYEDNELNGNSESSLNLWNYSGSSWASAGPKTSNDATVNYVEQFNLNSITNRWTLSGAISEFVWTGSIDNDWNKPGNWNTGGSVATRVPLAGDVVNIGSVTFGHQPTIATSVSVKNIVLGSAKPVILSMASGGSLTSGTISGNWSGNATHTINVNGQTINIEGDLTLSDGTIGHAINLNIGSGTVAINGSLVENGGSNITFTGAGNLKISENFNFISGTFTAGNGTVEYNGILNQEVGTVTYNNLSINKASGQAAIDNPITVNGNLSLFAGNLINNDNAIIKGNVTINSGSTLDNSNIIHIGGNWQNDGIYNAHGLKTIFDGTGTQSISKTTFNNLEFNKPVGSTAVLAGDVILQGNLVGTSGTLDIGSFYFNRPTVGGSASMADNATLIIAADNAPTNFANYFLSAGSTVVFNGTTDQHLQLPGLTYGNLIFRNSGTKILYTPVTVNTKISIENSAIFNAGSNTITLNGDWQNSGTFIPGSGTVTWDGANNTVSGATTFNKVTVSGHYNVTSNMVFNDLLTLTPTGAVSSGASQVHTMNGDLMNSGDLFLLGETIFTGTKLQTLSLINAVRTVAAVITFNGTVSPLLKSTSTPQFNILNINNTGGVNPSVGWTILSQLNVSAGASFNGGPFTQNLLGTLNNNGIITTSGTFNFAPTAAASLNFGTGFTSTGTTVFGGAGAITMAGSPVSFNNVTISNTNVSGITPSSNWNIKNNFLVNAGSIFNAATGSYSVGGNINVLGTLNKATSQFKLNGTACQSVNSASPFNNLTINKTSDKVILLNDVTIAGQLEFKSGNMATGNFSVIQQAGATTVGASQSTGWIYGNLQKYIPTGASSKTFEVGDSVNYSPVSVSFNNVSVAGNLLVRATPSDQPQLSTSAINASKSANRYWNFTNKGVAFDTYNATFNFLTQDIDAGAVPSEFKTGLYNGSSWTYPVIASPASTSIQATGVNSFGAFAIGQICNAGTSISYGSNTYCNYGTANVIFAGTGGGVFSSSPGLSIDAATGSVDLSASTPGVYNVLYTINATSDCAGFLTSAIIPVSAAPTISSTTTPTCVGGSTGTITVTPIGNSSPYLYSFNSGAYQSGFVFSGLAQANYPVSVKDKNGCIASASITVPRFANSSDDQNAAGSDVWVGHMYDGTGFNNYIGHFSESESFDEKFGGDLTCFNVASGTGTSSINTETFSVKFKMNSTKSGLYMVDAGSDDGGRLTVDGTIVHNVWNDHGFSSNPVLLNLNGSSSLLYEYYENGGGNRVVFNNLQLVLANVLSTNIAQSICVGNNGASISGDSFAATLPSGAAMPLYGTGYEWFYSTTATGSRIKISGADGPTFTPSTSIAPFNTPGKYYIFRNARLQTSYVAIHESNPAIITVLATNSISYPKAAYCQSTGTAEITLAGTVGGTFTAASGLNIDANTGTIDLEGSLPGSYVVKYEVEGSCPAYANVTISQQSTASISYPGGPYCTSGGAAAVTLSGTSGGVYSAPPGLSIDASTGTITPSTSTVGNYVVTYTIAASAGCSVTTATSDVMIAPPGSWTGSVSTEWTDAANWLCGQVPTQAIDVIIPAGLSNYPVVSNIYPSKNVSIATGGSLTISGGTLQVYGSISNSGEFNAINGTIEMKGSLPQSISGSMFENKTIKNLIVSNTGSGLSVSSAVNDTLKVSGLLSFGNANSILNTGDNITLVSNSVGTASVGILGSNNSINGQVTVERYINTGTAPGQHAKSWQFLAAPTNGQTIKQSWMENGINTSYYGAIISAPAGTSAGFDIASAAPSMKYYNYATNAWTAVSNTSNLIGNTQGYMIFVRGDRTVTGATQAANPTILRTKGTLNTGSLASIPVHNNKMESIGNPYASPIDFSVLSKDAAVDDKYYTWDPYLYGSYGTGGYQTVSATNNWQPVPGGTAGYPSGLSNSIIQSGQAFFVHATSTDSAGVSNVNFTENSKSVSNGSSNASRVAEGIANTKRQFLRASLITNAGLMADGNVVAFDKAFSNKVDGNDAIKLLNSGENFSVKLNGQLLAVNAKSPVSVNDTISYATSNLAKTTYKLIFAPENMDATGLQAFLVDKFLTTETPVSLTDSTFINVTVTTNASSAAADRFKIVFRQLATLPVTITSITATLNNKDVDVKWNVQNESGIQQYQVEKSADGISFVQSSTVNANNSVSGNYNWTDLNVAGGTYYYRIKIITLEGKISYSQIVKVIFAKSADQISVFPNPVKDGIIHLQLTNQPEGNYVARLFSSTGQLIISKKIMHSKGSSAETIVCPNLSKGIYQLEIAKTDGSVEVIKVMN